MFIPDKENFARTDLHYHVIMGRGEWMPHDPGHPDSFHRNVIFDNHLEAHKHFIWAINFFSPGLVDETEVAESINIWEDIKQEVQREHALDVMTFLGIEFNELDVPLAIIACNGCLPYYNN